MAYPPSLTLVDYSKRPSPPPGPPQSLQNANTNLQHLLECCLPCPHLPWLLSPHNPSLPWPSPKLNEISNGFLPSLPQSLLPTLSPKLVNEISASPMCFYAKHPPTYGAHWRQLKLLLRAAPTRPTPMAWAPAPAGART
jgi:hypothetical protein